MIWLQHKCDVQILPINEDHRACCVQSSCYINDYGWFHNSFVLRELIFIYIKYLLDSLVVFASVDSNSLIFISILY